VLSFVVLKAISLALNAARGISLAAILGPESYGVFGTLIVIQQYMSYLALGMREGVAISLARSPDSASHEAAVYSSSLAWGLGSGCLSIAVAAGAAALSASNPVHLLLVGLISGLSIVNEILVNINRHENKLRKIALVELVYNAVAIGGIWLSWQYLTVSHGLIATLAGLLVGVMMYVVTLRRIRLRDVSRRTIKQLVEIGFLPGVFSAALVLLASCYVVAANLLNLGGAVGLVVFGSNLGALILFALNTVSWALASRSMSRLYAPTRQDGQQPQTATADAFFRFGIIGAAALALGAQWLFSTWMTQYAGAEVYVLYFCLFQSYGLLLFSEVSFANVNGATKPIILGYLSLAAAFGLGCLFFAADFVALLEFSVVAHCMLALWIVMYCRRLGFRGGPLAMRIGALLFPVACMVAYRGGPSWVLAVCAVFFAAAVVTDGAKLVAALSARVSVRSNVR
jgi:hypothetical protein